MFFGAEKPRKPINSAPQGKTKTNHNSVLQGGETMLSKPVGFSPEIAQGN